MNAVLGRGDGDDRRFEDERRRAYEVVLSVAIEDEAALWHGAARRLRGAGLDPQEIDDTIGPVEDPLLSDCLSVLALPDTIEGCGITDFQMRPARSARPLAKLPLRPSFSKPHAPVGRESCLPPTAVCSLTIGTS